MQQTCFARHTSGSGSDLSYVPFPDMSLQWSPTAYMMKSQLLQPQTHKLVPDLLPQPVSSTQSQSSPFSSPALSFQPRSTEPVRVTLLFFSMVIPTELSSSLGLSRTTQTSTGLPTLSWVLLLYTLILTLELPVLDYEHSFLSASSASLQRSLSTVLLLFASYISLVPGLQRGSCV